MKFFHISDLHIGLRLMNRDLHEDQVYVLDQIVQYAASEEPDAVLIAGDIYDRAVPSAEAVAVFDRFITSLRERVPDCVIMMISGNHDSAPRIDLFRGILKGRKIYAIGTPPSDDCDFIEQVTLEDDFGPVHFYLLPYVRPSMVRKIVNPDEEGCSPGFEETLGKLLEREKIDRADRNVIVSHQFYIPAGGNADDVPRAASEIPSVGNIDAVSAGVLKDFDYCALGHIHRPMTLASPRIRYSGTPYPCSVSEAGQKKSVVCVEMGEKTSDGMLSCGIRELPLKPLREVRVIEGTAEEVLRMRSEDYVSVILTDEAGEDAGDLMWKLRDAFPNLLEVRRKNQKSAEYGENAKAESLPDPYELCCAFLSDPDEEAKKLLADVIRKVRGGV